MKNHKMILVIDDEMDIVVPVADALTEHGYKVIDAYDGIEGLAMAKTFEPDLIILDINMPKMSGLEFYDELTMRSNASRPPYPVLVLTASHDLEKIFKGVNIAGFMQKPFELDDLLEKVDSILFDRFTKILDN
ncbi:MAG: DNA-binding response OmpR family regulator [Candidatus Omnitrophota bacterium]|jgi:DNA-binding response OmpR family regulator